MDIDIGRRSGTCGSREIPAKLGAAKPDAFDLQHGDRLRQSEVEDDSSDVGRVAHAPAVPIAFDHKALPYGNLVADRSLGSTRIPGHMARPHAGEILLLEPVDHVIDRLALAERA